MANELSENVFRERPPGSTDYVDHAARLEPRDIVPMLLELFRRPEEMLAGKSHTEITSGLKAISYSGGYQWRVLSSTNAVGLAEKLSILEASFGFFARYLSPRKDLKQVSLMWWDDPAVQVRYEDDANVAGPIEEYVLRAKLLEILVRGLSLPSESAQLGCLNALDSLNDPRTSEIVRCFLDSGVAASEVVTQEAAQFL